MPSPTLGSNTIVDNNTESIDSFESSAAEERQSTDESPYTEVRKFSTLRYSICAISSEDQTHGFFPYKYL